MQPPEYELQIQIQFKTGLVTQSKKYSTPERSSERNKTMSSGNTADFLGLLNRGDRLQEAQSMQQQVKIIDLKD